MDDVARLYQRWLPRVRGIAERILGDAAEAEDVAQEAFLELWRHRGESDVPSGTRLAVVARSRALDRLRHRRVAANAQRELVVCEIDAGAGPSARRWFTEALDLLPDRQRRAIELAYAGGLTQADIARELGEPLGTVKTRIRLGLRRLASLLTEEPRALSVAGKPRA